MVEVRKESGAGGQTPPQESDRMTGLTDTYTAYGDGLTLLHDVTRLIVLSEITEEKHQTCWKKHRTHTIIHITLQSQAEGWIKTLCKHHS